MAIKRVRAVAGGSVVLVIALVVAGFIIMAGPAGAKQFATLHVLEGSAEVRAADTDAFESAGDGQTLEAGDTVRTASDGRAEIEYFDGSVTRLDFDTEFTLVELSEKDETKVIDGQQSVGNTFNRVVSLTDSESRFEVDTPTATASVAGTAFAIRVFPSGLSDVWVVEGTVVVVLEDGTEVEVQEGWGITVLPNGKLKGDPYPLTDWHLNQGWLQFNLCDMEATGCPDEVQGIQITSDPDANEGGPGGGNGVVTLSFASTTGGGNAGSGQGGGKGGGKGGGGGGGDGGGGGGDNDNNQGGEGGDPPPPPPPSGERKGCEKSVGKGGANPTCGEGSQGNPVHPPKPGGGNGNGGNNGGGNGNGNNGNGNGNNGNGNGNGNNAAAVTTEE